MAEETEGRPGRPPKFKSAKELQEKIDSYFESCFEDAWIQTQPSEWVQLFDQYGNPQRRQCKPFTISGLAVHLNTTRETLLDYEGKPGYSDTIKRAKARIENYTEEQLFDKNARNMTGIIFNLKNNYGWTDKHEVDNNIANKEGRPFETMNVQSLSIEELTALERIISKASETQ